MRQSQVGALQAALVECQRFVKAAKKALEKHKEKEEYDPKWMVEYPRGVAASMSASKRSSMDLTRALARFRRA